MNYTELVDASKAYADRQDIEVSSNMDVFIAMGEGRINRLLKTREQSCRAYIITVDGQEYYSLPSDYVGMRNIQLNSGSPASSHKVTPYHYTSPEHMDHIRQNVSSGKLYYTVIANQIHVYPCLASGQTIEIVYYQKVPMLTSSAVTNWLSINHPDAYLAAICAEISLFVKDYEVAQLWDVRLTRSIDELKDSDVEERWAGSSMTIRTL